MRMNEKGDPEETPNRQFAETLKMTRVARDCDSMIDDEENYARRDSNPQPMVPKTIALSS